jgi:hypothetical protein
MSHTLKITIELEDKYFDNDGGTETVRKLCDGLVQSTPRKFSFEELNKMLYLEGRTYYATSVDFADLNHSREELETKIVIRG